MGLERFGERARASSRTWLLCACSARSAGCSCSAGASASAPASRSAPPSRLRRRSALIVGCIAQACGCGSLCAELRPAARCVASSSSTDVKCSSSQGCHTSSSARASGSARIGGARRPSRTRGSASAARSAGSRRLCRYRWATPRAPRRRASSAEQAPAGAWRFTAAACSADAAAAATALHSSLFTARTRPNSFRAELPDGRKSGANMRKTDSRQSLLHFSPNRSPEASPQLPERLNLEGRGAASGFATTLRINTDGDTLLPPRDPRSDDSIELGGMLLFAPPKTSRLPPLAALSKSTPNLPRVTSNGSVVDIGEASPSNASDDPPPRAARSTAPASRWRRPSSARARSPPARRRARSSASGCCGR